MSETVARPSPASRMAHDAIHMPLWKKAIFGIALVVMVAGIAGQTVYHKTPSSKPQPMVTVTAPPGGSSGFISGNPTQPQAPSNAPTADVAEPDATSHAPAWMTATGGGFVGGFVIGWLFRLFIKTMLLLTVVAAAIIGGLSYFHVVNVDMTAARERYDTASAWFSSQGGKLWDATAAHLPTTGTGLTGLMVGLKRK